MPEMVVDAYINGEVRVPQELLPLVEEYRRLMGIRDQVDDPREIDDRENLVYEQLLEEVRAQ